MQRMIQRRVPCCLFSLLLLTASARGDGMPAITFMGESRAAALRLAEARKRVDEHKWSEAIEELQSILNTAGNDLVAIAPNHSVRAGRLCQIQLASLPAEALRLYRQRYESQAGKKLQQAQAERDIPQLCKLVEDAFCTRAAEKAIDLLGDLAFERGRFEEAEEWWRLLAPPPDARSRSNRQRKQGDASLVYPDLSLDPARVQAKQLLAQLFEDSAAHTSDSRSADDEWTAALEAYRQRHAKAEGTLAGRKGRYADLLQRLAEEMRKGTPLSSGRGSAPHSKEILDRLSDLIGRSPTWRFNLEQGSRQEEPKSSPAVNAEQARTLAFYPVIAGHHLLVADARYVTAFDVRNGKSEKWYDVAEKNGGVNPNLKLPVPPDMRDLRYTLTVSGEHVYARLGAQNIGSDAPPPPRRFGVPPPRRDKETFLACLSLRPGEDGGHFRWKIGGITPRENLLFEGAPVVAGGLIWIASTRYNGNRCFTAIDCYPADDSGAPPLRWRCDVCETSDVKLGEHRYRHQLLTLAGTQIVYCTHTGAVVAVDALTGRRNWAIRYPRRRVETEEANLHDLTPVLFAGGRLYVAPADSDTLLCLDPSTGHTLWELEPQRIVHLLGIGQGRLIFTTPTGLRAVGADNGAPDWIVPDTGELTPAGRGLLIGDLVLFPTTTKRAPDVPWTESVVYAIGQLDGRPAGDPASLHRLPAGNLVYANGILAVADRETLSVFVPPRLLQNERKAEAKTSDAKKTLDRSLIEKQKILLQMAQHAAENKRWQEAENSLEQAATISLPPRYRLHALLRAAQIWKDAEQTDRAAAVWQSIRADESLRDVPLIDRQGRPVSVATIGSPAHSASKGCPCLGSEIPSLPLFRSWHIRLNRDEWILAGWSACDADLLLTGSPDGRFMCRLTSTGEIRWTHRLPFAPCWAGCHADTILAAGATGVACLRRDNGQRIWHFPAPVAGRFPRSACDEFRVVLDPQPPEPLSDFQLRDGRLFFLQGQRRLFALDAETGAVLWDRWAPDGQLHLPYPRGCFSSNYHAGAQTVLLQMSGRRCLLDAATGRSTHEAADSRDLWPRLPLELDEHTLCVTPDSRHIALLDTQSGQCLWTHRLDGFTTRSGEIPSMLGRGKMLLCVRPANVGYFLQRLDRNSGKTVWPRSRLLTAKTVDLSTWTFDDDAVYGIEDSWLTARSLTDGEILWRRPLPDGSWQARRVGAYLAVWPQELGFEARFRFRSLLGTVQWDLGPLLAPDADFPLSCYDPKTGQVVQRLHFRVESPVRSTAAKRKIQRDGDRIWIARTSCLLASEDGPVVRLDSPRPFVAIGSEVWGLSATLEDKDSTANARH